MIGYNELDALGDLVLLLEPEKDYSSENDYQ